MKVFFTSAAARAIYLVGGILISSALLNVAFAERIVPAVTAQTDRFLESRINMIEQRFYGIESRISRVEQTNVRPAVIPSAQSDQTIEIQFLRGQIDSLRTRVGELECAMLRVDERTLSAAAKARRARVPGSTSERCRLDNGEAVQLSARP